MLLPIGRKEITVRSPLLVAALAASSLILFGLGAAAAGEQGSDEKLPEPALRFAKDASLRVSELERDWQKVAHEIAKAKDDFVRPLRAYSDTSLREEATRLIAAAKKLLEDEKRIEPETERFRDALKKAASHYREVSALYKSHAEKAKSGEVRDDYHQLVKLYESKAEAATDRARKVAVPTGLRPAREVIEEGNLFIERLLDTLSVGPVSEADCQTFALRLKKHAERCQAFSGQLSLAIEKVLGTPVVTSRTGPSAVADYVPGRTNTSEKSAAKGPIDPKAVFGASWTSTLTIRGVEYRQILRFKEDGTCMQSIYRQGTGGGLGPLFATRSYTFKLQSGGRLSVYSAGELIEWGKITVLSEDRWVYDIAVHVGDPGSFGSRINFVRDTKR